MRHRFLTATVATVLIGLASGQFPFRNGFQSSNYASFGNGPRAPVNYDNQASFISNSGYGIPHTNLQSIPAAGQASDPARPSFVPQIINQPPINYFQYANAFTNPVDTQLSSADSVIGSLENNPLIKQFLPGSRNANPVANRAQSIQNSQNGFDISYVPGSIISSLENDPLIKQFFPGSTNANPVANGAQLVLNSQNGFPISYVSGSNHLPNANPFYIVPSSNAASFYPQISNQHPINNLQYVNSFVNPVGSQFSSADSTINSQGSNPLIKQFLRGSTNPVTNGAQFIQNSQNRFPNPLPNLVNPLPNVNPSDIALSSQESNPLIKEFLNDPANQRQVINRAPNPLPIANPSNAILNSLENIPVNKQFLNDPANQQLVNNPRPSTLSHATPSDDVRDFITKIPVTKHFLDNPANQQLISNRAPNTLPNANSSAEVLDLLEKNPLVKQLPNDPTNQKLLTDRGPLKPRRRYRPPFPIRPNIFPNLNSLSSTDNYNTDVTENSPDGNKPTNFPTISNFSFTDDYSNNPTPSDVATFFTIITDEPSTSSVLNSGLLDYPLPSDVPLKYPKSDFPEGFFVDTLKSLGINSEKASTVASLAAVSTSRPTDVMSADNNSQNGAATNSSETNNVAAKATTVSPDSCGVDEVWWECKPLNNTCANVARGKSQKNSVCEPGCYCEPDLVKDVDGTCVYPVHCADPVCKDKDHEEITDCLIECNRCEDDCHPCKMQSCVPGCDCKDGYKRNDNGTCVRDSRCPPCPTDVISD